ncbi:MAG TPA: SDR family oxidoreductase [Burkholderiales bacterium]|nr:SDR family oxidoreductase [Burkholderiales bacterium]
MASDARIALVSGGNRGIGYAICKALAQHGVSVVLAARDAAKGKAAAKALQGEGLQVEFQRLDVTSCRSIRACVASVAQRRGRIDILINNAGVMIDPRGSGFLDSKLDTYRDTLEANLFGPLQLAQAVIPLMKAHRYGRIVNLSSGLAQLAEMKAGTPAYRISKTALNALTRILAAEFKESNVLVNAMCPGWVKTGMGGDQAPRTPNEGADTAVWLATLPDDGPSGGFFRDRKPLAW